MLNEEVASDKNYMNVGNDMYGVRPRSCYAEMTDTSGVHEGLHLGSASNPFVISVTFGSFVQNNSE